MFQSNSIQLWRMGTVISILELMTLNEDLMLLVVTFRIGVT